jgi:hypothetical protein
MSGREDNGFGEVEGVEESADAEEHVAFSEGEEIYYSGEPEPSDRHSPPPERPDDPWTTDFELADVEHLQALLRDFESIDSLSRALDDVVEAAGTRRRALQANMVLVAGLFSGAIVVAVLLTVWGLIPGGLLAEVVVALTALATGAATFVSFSTVRAANLVADQQARLRREYANLQSRHVFHSIERAAQSVGVRVEKSQS